MNDPEKKRLLTEILAEEADPGLRDALFGQTLQLVRRQRRARTARRAASVFAVFGGAVLMLWRFMPTGSAPVAHRETETKSYTLVQTEPMNKARFITTEALPFASQVRTTPGVEMVATTASAQTFAELDDDDLLKLAGSAAVVLVRNGPHDAELVFPNPEDRDLLF